MAKLEEILEILEDLYDLIVKFKTNYKKSPKPRITKGFLETRIQSLEDYWKSFKEAHQSLIKITSKEERKTIKHFKEENYSKCEEIYLDLKSDMADAFELFTTKTEALSQYTDASSHSPKKGGSYTTEVKLPRMVLPTYSGSYQDWQPFEDTFKALIHTNKSLSNVQKLHYLKSCLEGEAKNTIKHIQVTEHNYEEAWSVLRNRYSNKRLIVNATLKRLFSFRKINSQSPGQLKYVIDGTKECLNSLKSMNISTITWDSIIIYLTVQKLDADTHKEWETHVSQEFQTDLPTLQNFTNFLENKIQTLEVTFQASSITQRTNKERTFHTSSTQVICKFCNGEHILCHCKEFAKLDPQKRSEVVKTN
ncbi:uncharacterized protein LOC113507492 [Trichoplusia ni]|uniref:Uncharacterized protein LOC113507492 n=1 Tax=Trichoplusia ni TaxID=7111 RepID=A0A7E5WZ46_TRINI|nr:uncharacterized protein LOC113507492 [Trichoplusia ni]